MALACRFLDYPLFFIHPQAKHERLPRCRFNAGKSCALAESREKLTGIISKIPLYILLVNFNKESQPDLLGAGAAKLRIGRPGNSTPGEQHQVALHDPFGVPVAHARLHVKLSDHGASMHHHLLKSSRPDHHKCNAKVERATRPQRRPAETVSEPWAQYKMPANLEAAPGATHAPHTVHVHCHVQSPSPPRRRASPRRSRKSPLGRKSDQNTRKPARVRPSSTPRPQNTMHPPSGLHRIYPLSAPSTPGHPSKSDRSRGQPRTATAATQVPSNRHASSHSSKLARRSDASNPSKSSHRSSRSGRSVVSSRKIKACRRHGVAAQLYQQRLEQHAQQAAQFAAAPQPLDQPATHEAAAPRGHAAQGQTTPSGNELPPQQPQQGVGCLGACTVCSGPPHFKQAGVQEITAVACEMMTLVSMRAAMSQVMDGLVHQWQSGFSTALPGQPQAAAAVANAPAVTPIASRHSSMSAAAAVPPTPQTRQHPPMAAEQASHPGLPHGHAVHSMSPARRTVDGVMHAGGGCAQPPQVAADVRRSTAPSMPAVQCCESPSEVVVVKAVACPNLATARMHGSSPARYSGSCIPPDVRVARAATNADDMCRGFASPAPRASVSVHRAGADEGRWSAQQAACGRGLGNLGSFDEPANAALDEEAASDRSSWAVRRQLELQQEAACMDMAAEPVYDMITRAPDGPVDQKGSTLYQTAPRINSLEQHSLEQHTREHMAATTLVESRVDGGSAVGSSRSSGKAVEGGEAWSEPIEDTTSQAGGVEGERSEALGSRLESIRTETSGPAMQPVLAPAQQGSSSGETDYTIASESNFSSVAGGTTPGGTAPAAAQPPAQLPRRSIPPQSAVSMLGSSMSGSIMSDDSISIAGSASPASSSHSRASAPACTAAVPLPHATPSATAASHTHSPSRSPQTRPGAALAARPRAAATPPAAVQPSSHSLPPSAPQSAAQTRAAVSEAASSSMQDSSSEYDSVIDDSDASIVSSPAAPAAKTSANGQAGRRSAMHSATSANTGSVSELGISALNSLSDDEDHAFSRYSGNSYAIAAAAHAFGRPPDDAMSGSDGSGLLGLQMLDAHATRAGFGGGDTAYDVDGGSARTSDIDRSLDGASSSSGSYDGGATSGAQSSHTASDGGSDSGSDGASDVFSDMEW
eukprot:jgi/Ulvmu1/2053/UM120_0049.1